MNYIERTCVLQMSRHVMVALALIGGVLAWAPAMAADKVEMGWLPATDALPYLVAQDEKLFEKYGIEVSDHKFNAPTSLVDAFVANQIEVGPYGTAPGIALAAEAQNPGTLKLFGFSGGIDGTDYINSSLLVKKGSDIKSIADLKGKKIGHMPGVQWQTNTKYILRNAGMNPDKDAILTGLAPNTQIPAVVSGAIDALIAIEPMGSIAVAQGDVTPIVINVGAHYVTNPWFGGGAVMTDKFIKERPAVAKKVMMALRDATDLINKDFDKYKPLFAKYLNVPDNALPAVKKLIFVNERDVSARDFKSQQNVLDILYNEKIIPNSLKIEDKFVRMDDLK